MELTSKEPPILKVSIICNDLDGRVRRFFLSLCLIQYVVENTPVPNNHFAFSLGAVFSVQQHKLNDRTLLNIITPLARRKMIVKDTGSVA